VIRVPVADYDVVLQKGVRARVMAALTPAAAAEGVSPETLLDRIALAMKAVRNMGESGPGHSSPDANAVPDAYRREYASLHRERYFGVQVLYGIRSAPSRLVIIDATHFPALAAVRSPAADPSA
jgi:hypothetical protein